jgi:uncharacterized membrane protein
VTTAERWASRVLLVGGLLGVALMVSGVVGTEVAGSESLPPAAIDRAPIGASRVQGAETIVSLPQIRVALTHHPVDPMGLAALGVVVLFTTPMAAAGAAGVAFAIDGDRRFVLVSVITVAMLALSLWFGGA